MRFQQALPIALLSLFFACDQLRDNVPTSVPPSETALVESDEALQAVAKALASALGDAELRMQVLRALRASPYVGHALHLDEFLRTSSEVGQAIEAHLPISEAESSILSVLLSPERAWQLEMPFRLHRTTWMGHENVVVVASPAPMESMLGTMVHTGFDVQGNPVGVPTMQQTPYVVLTITQSNGPLDRRTTQGWAPGQETISTFEEEYMRSELPAIPQDPDEDCIDEEGDPTPCSEDREIAAATAGAPTAWLPSRWGMSECMDASLGGGDSDGDGLNDQCEYELARVFRPWLNTHPNDRGLGRYEHWVVEPRSSTRVEVFYALAYYRDYGPLAHAGDSEYITLNLGTLGTHSNVWYLGGGFLSAHWGEITDASEYLRGSQFELRDFRPVVHVAKNKHANYGSVRQCLGSVDLPGCPLGNGIPYKQVRVQRATNLGSYEIPTYPFCTIRRIPRIPGGRTECFWGSRAFRGWEPTTVDGSAGRYSYALWYHGFWEEERCTGCYCDGTCPPN